MLSQSISLGERGAERARLPTWPAIAAAVAVLVVLAVAVIGGRSQPLTSDESLYVAEGLNLAQDKGFTYPSGEAVNHRGPVYPLLLAFDFAIAGPSLDNAYWIPRLVALVAASALLALGWRLFGREAGLLAGGFVLAASLPALLANTLYLDGAETAFVLGALLALHTALRTSDVRWAAAYGAALGLAFLTKESAVMWLPLPFLMVLLQGRAVERPGRLLGAYGAGFVAVAGWWWPYVYAVTGQVYLLGSPGQALPWVVAGVAALALAASAATLAQRRDIYRHLSAEWRWAAAAGLLALWFAFTLTGLERQSTWSFSAGYWHTVPDYISGVLAPWMRPLPLIAVAWGYVGYRAVRGSLADRLLMMAFLLFLPFVVFVANRELHVRDLLPLVYLSYLALARSVIDFARWAQEVAAKAFTPLLAAGLVAGLLALAFGWFAIAEHDRWTGAAEAFDSAAVQQNHWDNPLAQRTAGWLTDNARPGTRVMSSRLYYSHLYFLSEGRYPVWQLPTVRVDFAGEPPALERATTLFRWQDHDMTGSPAEPWLYLRRYPAKGYYIALSEPDLLDELRQRRIDYVVLSGDDAGFSSLSLLPYFRANTAFREVAAFAADDRNQAHIFRVNLDKLASAEAPAAVNQATVDALQAQLGQSQAEELLEGMNPAGYEIRE